MPIYEYVCSACGQKSEVMQKISEPAPDACPVCGKPGTLSKMISRTSFQLKGGGWYQDLYSSSKKEGGGSSSSGGSEAKADSKPAGDSAASKPAPEKSTAPAAKPSGTSSKD